MAAQVVPNSNAMLMRAKAENATQGETQGDRKFITDLFARLNTVCTAGFHNLKSLSPSEAQSQIKLNMREWLNEFKISGMDNPVLIDYAMSRIRAGGSPFIPTVGEFIILCDEGRLPAGTKNTADSYAEYLEYDKAPRERRHPSQLSVETYATFSRICKEGKNWHLRHANEATARKCWEAAHNETLEIMKSGGDIGKAPAKVKELENKSMPAREKTVTSALAAMRRGL